MVLFCKLSYVNPRQFGHMTIILVRWSYRPLHVASPNLSTREAQFSWR